jgi:putative hemolysin
MLRAALIFVAMVVGAEIGLAALNGYARYSASLRHPKIPESSLAAEMIRLRSQGLEPERLTRTKFAGKPNTLTVYCSERGYILTYRSDAQGFLNEPGA